MCKSPLYAPHLSLIGMNILQRNRPLRGISNVRHHIQCFDWIRGDHIGNGRLGTGLGVVEGTHASSLVDGHAPSVGVNVGIPASAFESTVLLI